MIIAKRLLAVTAAMTIGVLTAEAEVEDRLAVAIGEAGSDSFVFGTELWAMSQIALKPADGVALDQREVALDEDRLALLRDRSVDAALVYSRVPNAYDDDLRAIMALWPQGISSDEVDPVQFLVHRDVPADVVYRLTKAMFDHAGYFRNAHASLGVGEPVEAMSGLDIPLHAGAFRYFEEGGFGLDAADAAGERLKASAAIFQNFDDGAFEPDEVDQIAAACRQALEVGSLSALLGDLSTTGCEVYQDRLTDAVAEPNDPFVSPVGQGGPAIRWEPFGRQERADDLEPLPTRTARQPVM